MKPMRRLWLLLPILCAACSGSPSAPSPPSVAGIWDGTLQSSRFSFTGSLHASLNQAVSVVNGTWGTNYPDARLNNSGFVSGSLVGVTLSLTLTPASPTACPYTVTAVLSGDLLTGQYAAVNCTLADSGLFTAARH